ncbi:MAG: CBASS cGAMP-activated phospholipase [Gemmatimonadota bacterium]
MPERPLRILSIDGGGIRGIIPGMVLAALESSAGKPVHELFDLVAGTSTGGILALGLTCRGEDGAARYAAADLVDLYTEQGADIFRRTPLRAIPGVGLVTDLVEEKYPARTLETVLEEYFGDARLRDALTDVIVPAYEIERRVPFFFKSRRAREDDGYDYPIRDVARATSAAPTYFEPHRIDVEGDYYSLIDGGVFANNPTMCAIAEALAVARDARGAVPDLVVASLGTGEHTRPIPHSRATGYGLIQWASRLLDVMMDGNSDTVRYQADQATSPGRHFRFQVRLDPASDSLDDASPGNVRTLRLLGEELVARNRDRLDRLMALLLPGPPLTRDGP